MPKKINKIFFFNFEEKIKYILQEDSSDEILFSIAERLHRFSLNNIPSGEKQMHMYLNNLYYLSNISNLDIIFKSEDLNVEYNMLAKKIFKNLLYIKKISFQNMLIKHYGINYTKLEKRVLDTGIVLVSDNQTFCINEYAGILFFKSTKELVYTKNLLTATIDYIGDLMECKTKGELHYDCSQ